MRRVIYTQICDMPHTAADGPADEGQIGTFQVGYRSPNGRRVTWDVDLCAKHAKSTIQVLMKAGRKAT